MWHTPLFEVALLAIIPKKDLALNGNRTDRTAEFFLVNPALFWRGKEAGLLNLANPVQYPYFFGDFSQKFPEISRNIHCTGDSPKSWFQILAKFLTHKKKNKSWSQPPKTYFAFWRNFAPKTKLWSQPPKPILHLAKFHTQKIRWSQLKTDFASWRNLEPKTKSQSQPQNWFFILAKLGAKTKNQVTPPKLISHFGNTWSQKQKPSRNPKTDFAFWRNLEP